MLITMLRHADRVKIACLAQLVNVIAPIMTSDKGAWRQTIYYPYYYTSIYGRGRVLQTLVDSPLYTTKNNGDVPYLDAVMVECDDGSLSLFAVNKSLEDDITLACDLRQYEGFRVERHIVLDHDDMKAENTENIDTVAPKSNGASSMENGHLSAVLKKHSWNMIRMTID